MAADYRADHGGTQPLPCSLGTINVPTLPIDWKVASLMQLWLNTPCRARLKGSSET